MSLKIKLLPSRQNISSTRYICLVLTPEKKRRKNSDVDILIDRTGSSIKSMFDMGGLYNDLYNSIGKDIDLVTTQTLEQKSTLNRTPQFVENLIAERIKIYE